jgi:hypothetical protein
MSPAVKEGRGAGAGVVGFDATRGARRVAAARSIACIAPGVAVPVGLHPISVRGIGHPGAVIHAIDNNGKSRAHSTGTGTGTGTGTFIHTQT